MKAQHKLLSEQEQELIKQVAGQIMGWTVLEKYAEFTNSNATCFFLDNDPAHLPRPTKGTTYPHNVVLIKHGASAYGIKWEHWNPLTDPVAYTEVIEKLIEAGCQVTVLTNREGSFCLIQESGAMLGESNQAPTAGQAICQAAMKLYKAIYPLEYAWSKRPESGEQIEVYTTFTQEWIPCTYREGGASAILKFADQTFCILTTGAQAEYSKWRPVFGTTKDQAGDEYEISADLTKRSSFTNAWRMR